MVHNYHFCNKQTTPYTNKAGPAIYLTILDWSQDSALSQKVSSFILNFETTPTNSTRLFPSIISRFLKNIHPWRVLNQATGRTKNSLSTSILCLTTKLLQLFSFHTNCIIAFPSNFPLLTFVINLVYCHNCIQVYQVRKRGIYNNN